MKDDLLDQLDTSLGLWHKQILGTRDTAIVVERLFARGLPIDQYSSLPQDVQRQILHDLGQFAVHGTRTLQIAHSSIEPSDESETMRTISAAFKAAGFWSTETSLRQGEPGSGWKITG